MPGILEKDIYTERIDKLHARPQIAQSIQRSRQKIACPTGRLTRPSGQAI